MYIGTAQKIYTGAKARAGVEKVGGIHGLRHAYATQRYVHWVPGAVARRRRPCRSGGGAAGAP